MHEWMGRQHEKSRENERKGAEEWNVQEWEAEILDTEVVPFEVRILEVEFKIVLREVESVVVDRVTVEVVAESEDAELVLADAIELALVDTETLALVDGTSVDVVLMALGVTAAWARDASKRRAYKADSLGDRAMSDDVWLEWRERTGRGPLQEPGEYRRMAWRRFIGGRRRRRVANYSKGLHHRER
ncbi:hypothetical protein A0H81_05143 [Grifola frondosa]|uniref:Uncharacterized protein n=1 Tax=Grifola frondosa TaxID=5627 RepID=A0A1C7MIQ4_GRIFR|nr:hypothetical protein A0H81_05143 [Grifola frondosa]